MYVCTVWLHVCMYVFMFLCIYFIYFAHVIGVPSIEQRDAVQLILVQYVLHLTYQCMH